MSINQEILQKRVNIIKKTLLLPKIQTIKLIKHSIIFYTTSYYQEESPSLSEKNK